MGRHGTLFSLHSAAERSAVLRNPSNSFIRLAARLGTDPIEDRNRAVGGFHEKCFGHNENHDHDSY